MATSAAEPSYCIRHLETCGPELQLKSRPNLWPPFYRAIGYQNFCLGEFLIGSTIYLGTSIHFGHRDICVGSHQYHQSKRRAGCLAGGLSFSYFWLALWGMSASAYSRGISCLRRGLVSLPCASIYPAEVSWAIQAVSFWDTASGICLMMLTQGESIYSPVLPLFLLGTPVLTRPWSFTNASDQATVPSSRIKIIFTITIACSLSPEQAVISIYFLHFTYPRRFGMRFCTDYIAPVYILIFALLCFYVALFTEKY